MTVPEVGLTPWPGTTAPSEDTLVRLLAFEGLQGHAWSNGPGDFYAAHSHPYHKVIYVVQGSITFGLPALGTQVHLEPGDRLDLPAGVVHNALVGPEGVICLEAHRLNAPVQ